MGFRNGAYATIWEVKAGKGNYSDVRLSISKKNKQTDQYETDFSGFVRFIGTAHQNAGSLKEKDRIKIGDCEVTNSYDKEKKVTYTNFAVFSFEDVNGNNNSSSSKPKDDSFVNIPDGIDEELPFS
jgi:hypothetical protein